MSGEMEDDLRPLVAQCGISVGDSRQVRERRLKYCARWAHLCLWVRWAKRGAVRACWQLSWLAEC